MLLTITTTHTPATDLGYLLHKHPARCQTFELSFGKAHVFYPEASQERCTAALLLDLDPIGIVRTRRPMPWTERTLRQYVNDRPYSANSFLSVAIARVFGSALAGRCTEEPELAGTAIPLRAQIAVLPCSDEKLLRRLFEPLGYSLTVQPIPLDETFPDWGRSIYSLLTIEATCRLSDLLSHLYVLIPVLDDEKHYWAGEDEVEKLLRHGEGWLATHPERKMITFLYLRHNRTFTREVIARLSEEDDPDTEKKERKDKNAQDGETDGEEYFGLIHRLHAKHERERAGKEPGIEEKLLHNQVRVNTVLAAIKGSGAKRVLDLGCGDGRLLKALLEDRSFELIVGMDVSQIALEKARRRLSLDRLTPKQQERIRLMTGSLMYRDDRLKGYDAVAAVEVIEHLDPSRLAAFERVLFEFSRPTTVIITTPNAELNIKLKSWNDEKLRHKDHRFEWTRTEFQDWANHTALRFGYAVRFEPIGLTEKRLGPLTQMAIFSTET